MAAGLSAIIPGGISPEDFATVTGMTASDSERALGFFVENGIGRLAGGQYVFEGSDRLSAAMLLVERGALIDDVSVHLDWRSFESLTARILESRGFATVKNLILTKPRMEIDVVGINHGVAMLIDCKHWRRYSPSAMRAVVRKQVERTKRYVAVTEGAMAVPVIVTLYQDAIGFVGNVPIVPILRFPSFVDEFYGNLDDLKTIGTG